jgi:hypothetical protein
MVRMSADTCHITHHRNGDRGAVSDNLPQV